MKSRFATIWMDNPPPPASARSTLSAAGCSRIYMAHLAPGRGDWSKVLQLVDPLEPTLREGCPGREQADASRAAPGSASGALAVVLQPRLGLNPSRGPT